MQRDCIVSYARKTYIVPAFNEAVYLPFGASFGVTSREAIATTGFYTQIFVVNARRGCFSPLFMDVTLYTFVAWNFIKCYFSLWCICIATFDFVPGVISDNKQMNLVDES